MSKNTFGSLSSLKIGNGSSTLHRLDSLEKQGISSVQQLPFSIKILLEQALRNVDGFQVTEDDVVRIAQWSQKVDTEKEIPFKPTRVVLQDFTGVPAVVDLAALRTAMVAMGGDPAVINPRVPVQLVIDHSVQVDAFGNAKALKQNMDLEFERNQERYAFLKWGQRAFQNFTVVPPGVGIIHQVNLEYLASVVQEHDGLCFPDTLVGTDSHTTMINGVGVLGWGVGGLEAESVMLGQPISMLLPEVVGLKLKGSLPPGTTATDLVLRIVEILRIHGVVEKFVEFYGPGLSHLSLADRATIANMAPEYGATMGFFPVDQETLSYLKNTGRSEKIIQRVDAYCKEQGLFRTDSTPDPIFTETLELDLASIESSLAGPKRPQDRVTLSAMKNHWQQTLTAPTKSRGFELKAETIEASSPLPEYQTSLKHGSVVIAAITSCTNTSNPSVMLGAGLLAQKAVAKGLMVKPWIKTSLAPGSRVVTDYLDQAGLTPSLEKLGFYTVGYGCTTCIGNSGPLSDPVVEAIHSQSLVVAAVLSGNRNFEGRISPEVKANYLASPPLVVAYAIAGRMDIDFAQEPLGIDPQGQPVFLHEIWPTAEEINSAHAVITPQLYQKRYEGVENSSPIWNDIPVTGGNVYVWNEDSSYIQNPPFFENMKQEVLPLKDIQGARVLVKVGDSVTTDHISPAGSFAGNSPAGKYLIEKGVPVEDFNSYGSRRGNDRVMTRGTFANVQLRNQLAPGTVGGWTRHIPTDAQMTIYEASCQYKDAGIPLIVLAGAEYGTGSSRDWAAKGTFLLGIKAVVATSFERIHRSNLIGMGVLPLEFKKGESHQSLGLTGKESFSILGIHDGLKPKQELILQADDRKITVVCRLDTAVEIEYYRNGGILHTVLRNFIKG